MDSTTNALAADIKPNTEQEAAEKLYFGYSWKTWLWGLIALVCLLVVCYLLFIYDWAESYVNSYSRSDLAAYNLHSVLDRINKKQEEILQKISMTM
jgi:hypothetical protein